MPNSNIHPMAKIRPIWSPLTENQQLCNNHYRNASQQIFTGSYEGGAHFSTLFNIFQHFSTFFNIFQHCSTFSNIFQHFSTFFNIFQHFSTFFNIFQHFSTLFSETRTKNAERRNLDASGAPNASVRAMGENKREPKDPGFAPPATHPCNLFEKSNALYRSNVTTVKVSRSNSTRVPRKYLTPKFCPPGAKLSPRGEVKTGPL
jgi:hypothetical protein